MNFSTWNNYILGEDEVKLGWAGLPGTDLLHTCLGPGQFSAANFPAASPAHPPVHLFSVLTHDTTPQLPQQRSVFRRKFSIARARNAMQSQAQGRPYRSHLRPACVPCRRRKSRCQTEPTSSVCLMCRAHQTACLFPDGGSTSSPSRTATSISRSRRWRTHALTSSPRQPTLPASEGLPAKRLQQYTSSHNDNPALALESPDEHDHNLHIVGPAVVTDSQVLADYLARFPGLARSTRMVIPESAGRSMPVLFTMVQKRPLGTASNQSLAAEKLHIIEQLLQPHAIEVIDE